MSQEQEYDHTRHRKVLPAHDALRRFIYRKHRVQNVADTPASWAEYERLFRPMLDHFEAIQIEKEAMEAARERVRRDAICAKCAARTGIGSARQRRKMG